MVFIARAMAQGADTLILDEPTNHLDIRSQLFLMDFLKKSGKTVLVVLHDLRLASHYCDHLYLLSEGRVFAQGDPMEVLGEEKVEQVYKIQGHIREDADRGRDFVLF